MRAFRHLVIDGSRWQSWYLCCFGFKIWCPRSANLADVVAAYNLSALSIGPVSETMQFDVSLKSDVCVEEYVLDIRDPMCGKLLRSNSSEDTRI